MKKITLQKAIHDALVRRVLATLRGPDAEPREGVEYLVGPYWTNRAMDRANRGYGHGLGAMAPSVKRPVR